MILGLVIFVLSNRVPVQAGFWPFGTLSVWLGPLVVGVLAVGFFIGRISALPKHWQWRRRARAAEKRVAELTPPPAASQPTIVK